MDRKRRAVPALIVLLTACVAEPELPPPPGGGEFSVHWMGSDTANVTGDALARWCAGDRWLELTMIRGDTGVGLAVYPVDSLDAGSYPVVEPAGDSALRPSAAVGVRWYGDATVPGFRGTTGAVELEQVSGTITGRVEAVARSVDTDSLLQVEGRFADVPVRAGCG